MKLKLLILLLIPVLSNAQKLDSFFNYGSVIQRVFAPKVLAPPHGDTGTLDHRYFAIAIGSDNNFYYSDSTKWRQVSGAGGGTTIQSVQYATAPGQVAFTFASVPASYADYDIFLNGDPMVGAVDFTTSGNVVTFTYPLFLNDQVIYRRKK